MSGTRVRCIFCFAESGDNIEASAEHFISKPVAKAFRIDRRSRTVARMNADGTELRWVSLDSIKRKCVCRTCNSGWLNELESGMVGVAAWYWSESQDLEEVRTVLIEKTGNLLEYVAVPEELQYNQSRHGWAPGTR